MTISILSQAAASPKGLVVQNGATAGEDIALGNTLFAGLFGQQLSQLTALSANSPGTAGGEGESTAGSKKSAKKTTQPEELVPAGQIVALQPVQVAVTSELKLDQEPVVAASAQGDEVQEGLLAGLGDDKPLAAGAQKLPVEGAAFGQFLPVHAAASTAAQPSAEAAQTKVLSLPLPISDSNWSKAMSEQMLSLVSVKADKAQIQINPPELGPIDVTLKLNHDQVQVTFSTATPLAREAVENSLPKLASMLASSGLQLADAQVSSGQSGDPRQQQRQTKAARPQEEAADGNDTLSLINKARNVLSIFA